MFNSGAAHINAASCSVPVTVCLGGVRCTSFPLVSAPCSVLVTVCLGGVRCTSFPLVSAPCSVLVTVCLGGVRCTSFPLGSGISVPASTSPKTARRQSVSQSNKEGIERGGGGGEGRGGGGVLGILRRQPLRLYQGEGGGGDRGGEGERRGGAERGRKRETV